MAQTRIKICGITRPADAAAAAAAGADAIGLVFYPPSPRAVSIQQARAVVDALPPFVSTVGLFLDADRGAIDAVLAEVPLTLLQFHGHEGAAYCRSFGRPWLKAVGMASVDDLAAEAERYPDARGLLADSCATGAAGGTGETFAWSRVPRERSYRLILAGGLGPENVAEAVATVRPDAVDVSTGVEQAPGRKDPARIQRFIEEVRSGERNAT